uniref:Brain tumor protein n=1 Tax=Timema monikensis TaxID=170555 RepID=A0A7R9HSS8_9NEOP|nr:unnamed protein product [Timema monikensis]
MSSHLKIIIIIQHFRLCGSSGTSSSIPVDLSTTPLTSTSSPSSPTLLFVLDKYCSPRVLSCLHVFCEGCLDKMLIDGGGDSSKRETTIKCPTCRQDTKVCGKGASSLPCDYVLTNLLDMSAIQSMAVLCTSCKTKEKAVARCADCANFLCPNCNTAHQVSMQGHTQGGMEVKYSQGHSQGGMEVKYPQGHSQGGMEVKYPQGHSQGGIEVKYPQGHSQGGMEVKYPQGHSQGGMEVKYPQGHSQGGMEFMRCFENHQVVAFEDLKNSHEAIPIHKPIFCETHSTETMKFYCVTCQTLICNDCLLVEHKLPEHRYERLQDAHETHRGELSALVAEGRTKLLYCEEASCQLEGALSELQVQHDAARELVQETFHSYKAVIERCRDAALERLKSLHKQRELGIMDTCDSVEKVVEKMNHACKFTSRLLEHGNAPEVLALKKTVGAQLLYLINNTPKCNVNTAIHFDTDMSKFEDAVKATFGSFRTEPVTTPKESSPAPVTPLVLNGAANSSNNNSSANTTGRSSVMTTSSSPVSLSVSMQSSFEGDLAAGVVSQGTALPPMLSPPEVGEVPPGVAPALHGLTSIQEYNLQQLANLAAEKEVVGAEEPSPAPSFTLADLFSGDMSSTSHALNNLQALAKLGNISLNNQGRNRELLELITKEQPDCSALELMDERARLESFNCQLVVNGAPAGVDTLGAATLPSQTLGALLSDLAASALNGTSPVNGGEGSIVLGRGASPSLSVNTNIASINGGSFPTLSGTPSPMLSPEELLTDGLHTMPPPPTSGLAPPPPQSNFHLMRNSSGKITPMQIRCKYGQLGPAKGQFNSPHGFCLGSEEDIIVADTNNHRIQVFEKTGTFKFQFGIPGKEEGQLWYPRKVAVMRNSGKFVVCDRGNERSRMQIFTKNGHFIKKIAIR